MRDRHITLAALALVCAGLALPQSATAQQDFVTFRQQIRPSPPKGPSHLHRRSGDARMRVKSDGVDYDYINHQFAAVGNVQIYYNGATIEADRVVYDQVTKRLRAECARLTEANGKVTVGQVIDSPTTIATASSTRWASRRSRVVVLRANRSDGGRRCANNRQLTAPSQPRSRS